MCDRIDFELRDYRDHVLVRIGFTNNDSFKRGRVDSSRSPQLRRRLEVQVTETRYSLVDWFARQQVTP